MVSTALEEMIGRAASAIRPPTGTSTALRPPTATIRAATAAAGHAARRRDPAALPYYAYIEIADARLDTSSPSPREDLWRAYAELVAGARELRHARGSPSRADIYPVFRKLFAKQQ